MHIRIALLLGVFGLILATAPSFAGWEDGPCAEDVKKFCSGIKPGHGSIIKCLKEHEAELSPACKEKRDEKKSKRKEERSAARAACRKDAEKLCPDVKKGGGRIIACIQAKQDELSASCREKIGVFSR